MTDHSRTGVEQPFQPEIPRSRFALGTARYPRNMDELRVGRFSDGQQTPANAGVAPHRGRFSEGQERLGDEAEKHIRRRYSEGMETQSARDAHATPVI
jgi:hypothetical protein